MKTWITYIAAIAMGFAANLLVGDLEILKSVVASAVPILLDLGMFILFPLAFILFASGIASLRRQAETTLFFSSTILWSLATTLVLSCFAAALYFILPLGMENVTTNGADAAALSTINAIQPSQFFAMIVNRNSFLQFVMTDQTLLPILVCMLLGLLYKPGHGTILRLCGYELVRKPCFAWNGFQFTWSLLVVSSLSTGSIPSS